jgi:peptide/nickel transport system ATP-binding protein
VDRRGERLRPIPGVVPAAHDWPTGCRFADRCPYVWERGREEPPPLLELAPGRGETRAARCWLVQEPERRRAAPAGADR